MKKFLLVSGILISTTLGAQRSNPTAADRWVDSVFMQRPLGAGDGTPPARGHAAPAQR